jgi:hypothetical protein
VNRWSSKRGGGQAVKWLVNMRSYAGHDCLIWPFSRLKSGYGNFGVDGRQFYAHRFMCELTHGPAPSRKHVAAHSCGRGSDGCVNPTHLSWKTQLENERDKAIHGRNAWTRRNGKRYKLTALEVAKIRSLEGKKTVTELEAMFGVTRSNIRKILQGKSWPTGHYAPKGKPKADPRLLGK